MKFSELAKYCESIEIDCFKCEHKKSCDKYLSFAEEQSPAGMIKMIEEDREF